MSVSNSDNVIDSRDIISRIAELEQERDTLTDELAEREAELEDNPIAVAGETPDAPLSEEDRAELTEAIAKARDAIAAFDDSDDGRELATLRALAEQCEGYCSDWRHGATLISDDYFTQYAEQLAEDIGAISRDAAWPANHIDWDAAADALKADYTEVDYDGTTYWIRS